jgi:hypothetical protein
MRQSKKLSKYFWQFSELHLKDINIILFVFHYCEKFLFAVKCSSLQKYWVILLQIFVSLASQVSFNKTFCSIFNNIVLFTIMLFTVSHFDPSLILNEWPPNGLHSEDPCPQTRLQISNSLAYNSNYDRKNVYSLGLWRHICLWLFVKVEHTNAIWSGPMSYSFSWP